MSQKAASDFVGQLAVDAALRGELTAALAGAPDRSELCARMVAFAAKRSYEVTEDELAEFALLSETELSEDQLSQAAGGIGITAVLPRRSSVRSGGGDCADSNSAGSNCAGQGTVQCVRNAALNCAKNCG
jgi:hypothetical protein